MRLLIIGPMSGQIGAASKIAVARGAQVTQSDTIESGLDALRGGRGADLIMVDVSLDVGLLVVSLKNERINVPVIGCGIANDAETAVRAIKAGAQEYIPLPPNEQLISAVFEAVSEESHRIVHGDPAMARALKLAEQVSGSIASILVVGDSGTGKELIARFIHQRSPRRNAPFIAVNCAAIPENLLESELFGYEKGAFTGAVARRIGKFEEATGGTLLLDEISEMDLKLQSKLLRAIQEKEIDRIGGKRPIPVDVRIVATSNRNMEDEVAARRFREDLYYRLNVVMIEVPKLAHRPGDIEPLSRHFVEKFAEANDMGTIALAPESLQLLKSYAWPGNVRELENTIHRGVLLSTDGIIRPDAIRLQGQRNGSANDGSALGTPAALVGRALADVERDLIIDTLGHTFGNRTHAATILGISIRTLRNKLKQYNDEGFSVPVPGDGGSRANA